MIVNATTCSKVTKLLSKTVGHSIEGGSKVLGEHGLSIIAPANARTYDVACGIGKKGKFQLFAFKDGSGNVVQNYTRYFKDNNHYTDVVTDIENNTNNGNGLFYLTRKIINGILKGKSNIEKIEHNSMLCFKHNGKRMAQKSFMTMTPADDFGGQEILQQGKKAIGFKHNYGWNGEPINIEYKNTLGQKLDLTEAEAQYLPFIHRRLCIVEQNGQKLLGSQDFTADRVNEKIELAQIIQEKSQGIPKGLLPKAKAVKQDDLVVVKATGKSAEQLTKERGGMYMYGEALPNGQINIAVDVPDGTDGFHILIRMAHETQHEADIIKMYKGGDEAAQEALNNVGKTFNEAIDNVAHERQYYDSSAFYNKCVERNGIFPKGTPEYDEAVKIYERSLNSTNARDLTDITAHDAMSIEKGSLEKEVEQTEVCNNIATKVGAFLNQFIA